ncbi:hypothetical protein EST38_g7919 [Candolleomyces aberdarensis]|uniref:Uncharacterized protein n=1 Tax=Candolleomyces aberdarensis TaxID=2316362 RepID=A0A4Q2DFQ6_9AGAR|nr:hypothetical protein EST38_g7919 [Candolleomyces aberdarensis]
MLANSGNIATYALEKLFGMDQLEQAVRMTHAIISRASSTDTLESSIIPYENYDYSRVLDAWCEGVFGDISLLSASLVLRPSTPVEVSPPSLSVTVTRDPAIDFSSAIQAGKVKAWIESDEGHEALREAFEPTSRFANLKCLKAAIAGRTLYVRHPTTTGDAMGMTMISKGMEKALEVIPERFTESRFGAASAPPRSRQRLVGLTEEEKT